MREALILTLVLVSPVLAGCIGEQPAALTTSGAPTRGVDDLVHELGEVLDLRIPVSGGVHLAGTVYLPDVEEGAKVPVILDMGPYYGNLNGPTWRYNEKHPPHILYEHFLRRGYAIALLSVRGTGESGGCFLVGGPEERADAAAAVEHLAAQAWSNGRVAMTGVSYDGTTPWEAAVSGQAPSLKAIIPVAGISDFYRYSFYEGVPVGGGAAFNTYYKVLVDHAFTDPSRAASWAAVQPSNLCPEQAETYLAPYQTYRDGVHGPYWDERDMSAMLDQMTVPAFVVHGTKDFNVKMDHAQYLWGKLPEGSRMLFGQWTHNIPWRNTYDKEQSWHEYNATMDQFLDAYLKEDPVALAAEQAAARVLLQDSANRTWQLSAWPPVESRDEAWHLGDRTLSASPAAEGQARVRASPVAQAASGTPLALVAPGERLVFETDAFAADALFIGNPYLTLNVTVDRPEGRLSVALYELDAKGERKQVSAGWQDLALRTSRDAREDVPVGEPMSVRIPLLALAQQVEKGNKLVLEIAPENRATSTPHVQATTFTIALGGDDGAVLWLPRFTAP